MGVYVDSAIFPRGRRKFCHLFADSLKELHDFAERIGVRRCWYDGKRWPHYDIDSVQRERAVEAGAEAVNFRATSDHARRWMNRPR